MTKLNGAGNALIYSTYLSDASQDYGNGIAVTSSGTVYYDALRDQNDGFNLGGILGQRQSGREMDPGLYASRNIGVAQYFAYYNSDTILGFPGQGGPALMTITISQKKFAEMLAKYSIIDNRPVLGLPAYVPQPHAETLFPYTSLPELFMNAKISVELLPIQ